MVITAVILTGCSIGKNRIENQAFEADSFAMGTVISQKVYGKNGQVAVDKAANKITYLDSLLTFNDTQGDIYKLNLNAGIKGVELNPETVKIINKAQEVSAISRGAFDISVGPLVKAWGIGTNAERVPTPEELNKLLPLINYKDIDVDNNVVSIKRKGQMVDLGGIAKGYAGDAVIEIYKQYGVNSAFINLGGNVVTVGNKPDGSPWKVGIRNPRPAQNENGKNLGIVKVADKAVVTAGDDQRYFIGNGQRYHHILDPQTGYPARSDLMSVTLITDSSLDADALDTAVFILGFDRGRELLQQYGGVEAVFVTIDKKVYATAGLRDSFEFLGENSGYVYEPIVNGGL
ncbi:MAG: FAD:protein FMN transferase [Syntrophomonas sp.]|nr:FAD:protein FMN transferase [Syntrophomonas sp.]